MEACVTVKIKLREGVAQRVRRRLGCDSDNQVAHRLGVAPSTWNRAARGVTSPGPKLSSALLGLGFSPKALFEVVAEPAELAGAQEGRQ